MTGQEARQILKALEKKIGSHTEIALLLGVSPARLYYWQQGGGKELWVAITAFERAKKILGQE